MGIKKVYQQQGNLTRRLVFHPLGTLRLVLLATLLLAVQVPAAWAQASGRISGKVISAADNQGIPGASVVVKGTTAGTTTNAEGEFTLDAAADAVLVISYIGFTTQEVPVTGKSRVDVSLAEDVKALSEVVVVGYGEIKRSDITSAQTTITSKEIERTVNTTIEQAIQGRTAGVYVTQNTGQPGGGVSVNIRGINTINGTNEPLYVIDGVQIQPTLSYGVTSSTNPLAFLNPSDIESMEILQGPSATAIYGSRATNGVVLITTKRGKAGDVKVSYGYSYNLQDRPKLLETMNLRQYAQMTGEIRRITGGTPQPEFLDPSILGEGTNWQQELFRRAPLNKHQLSLSGGSEKTTFYLSGEYFDQQGVAQGSSFDRYSVRLNVDNQARKWLKLGANINVSQTNESLSTQENVILNALTIGPHIAVRNPDGTWGGADETNGSSVQFTPLNPVAIASLVENNFRRRQVLGGINTDINLLKGLVFRTTFSGNLGFNSGSFFTPTYQLGDKPNDIATLARTTENSSYWNWNQLLQYNLEAGRHSFGAMVSHEAQASNWERVGGTRRDFVSNDLPDLELGSTEGAGNQGGRTHWAMESYLGRLNYTFGDKYIVQATGRFDGSARFGPQNKWGFFPSVSAAWRITQEPFMQNLPVINELKLRVETGATGNQGNISYYGPLQSRATPWGAGFRLDRYPNLGMQWEETKTNNIGFNLSVLQNRIQLEGDFYVKKTNNLLLENPLPDYMGTNGEGRIQPPNVNIGELENRGYAFTLNTINVDRGGFRWNTNFNVSGFRTEVTKFYSETAFVSRSAWYMNNWTQRATVGEAPWLFRGYIEEGLFGSVDEINNSAIPADNNGNRLAVAPGSVWVGDVKYKDQNGDGIIDERDETTIGNPWPKATFGLTNTFTYKGLDLSILFTAAYGNDVFNYLRYSSTNPNNINLGRNLLAETFNYARVEGEGEAAYLANPGTTIPRLVGSDVNGNGQRFTQKYVEDGSYLRLKNISLGYSLPASLLGKQPVVKGARFQVGVQNLATFTKYKGYDPEVGAYVGRDGDPNSPVIGVDYGRYPLTPIYTFSVGVDF